MSTTVVSMLKERGYSNRQISVIGSAFSWVGIDIPVIPVAKSFAGKLLITEAYALREKRRMDKEYFH